MSQFGSDPNRLVDQPNSLLVRGLLRAGTEVHAPPGTRDAVLEALGLQDDGHPSVKLSRPLPFRRAGLLLAAMVISAAAVALPIARSGIFERVPVAVEGQPDASNAPLPEVSLRPSGAGPASQQATSPAPDENGIEATRLPEETTSVRSASTPRSAARNALAAEIAALDAVRAKLRAGEPKSALVLLDALGREFARPKLALEAEVLRIDALERAGQREAARKRAAIFVQNHPKGVLTGRVRRYLDQ